MLGAVAQYRHVCRDGGHDATRRAAWRKADVVGVAGASERAAAVRVAVGQVRHVGEADNDRAGSLEPGDYGRILRRDEFVPGAPEALPPGRRHLAFHAGVRLDHDRHAPERPASTGARPSLGILARGLRQRLTVTHGLDCTVDAVVAVDPIEMPLHHLGDGVRLVRIQAMQLRQSHVQQIAVDRGAPCHRLGGCAAGDDTHEAGEPGDQERTALSHPQSISPTASRSCLL